MARVKVVPNEQTLNSAQGRVENAKLVVINAEKDFARNEQLYEKGILSERDFNVAELSYKQAKQELVNVENDLQIIREGSTVGTDQPTPISERLYQEPCLKYLLRKETKLSSQTALMQEQQSHQLQILAK